MTLRELTPDDLRAACALLAADDLPTADLADPAITLVGAFDGESLAGVIGLQACDGVGLLRSLAVAPAHRDRGIARRLCERVFELAAERRLALLWLLTTSARDYFTRHGFAVVARDAAPAAVRATAQFASMCPSSAQLMRR